MTYEDYLKKTGEYGEVTDIKLPLVTVVGIPTCSLSEIVYFQSGIVGQVFAIHRSHIEIILFNKKSPAMAERVVRTGEKLSVPVGIELLGHSINPIGENLLGGASIKTKTYRPLDGPLPGITARASIKKPLHTGVTLVDMLLPLGKGQKQLIIGDRKTGKTSLLLTMLKAQVLDGAVVIYTGIGKKQSDIKHILSYLEKENIAHKTVLVASTSSDSPGMIYLTPFTAMSIAEGFRDLGMDVVVVFDDLSTHAKFYREMSLIGKRFPGRESYPGDIFFTHSRLLERAGNFKIEKGEVSITALPVVETIESDLTSYIATNIMSMTDGHIFFDQGTFAKGRRPAINVPLSVTRVGRQAQSPLKRDINQKLTAFISLFEQMENLSHFGAELSGKVQNTLKTGEKLNVLFNQGKHTIIPEGVQLVVFALIWGNMIEDIDATVLEEKITKLSDPKAVALIKDITSGVNLDELLLKANQKKPELEQFLGVFKTVVTETVTTTPAPPTEPGSPDDKNKPTQTTQTTEFSQTDSVLFVPIEDKKTRDM
ncbi:hypothetical protein A3D80_03065 [Candidatus Roizmanbacteria bacterium RIFCSPHIGHO2_02_FULL_40_13b]|uniref:ATPase F1/V1/A1 complex alpha/beta subunit nucleotide-binding domain-containing protein n=1 Tax=Candidatus Roizmanbacteria bacterium RIFCSPHIGHO2_01_FULL_39_24 TaxID=1802032 RepID=A0A1F7GJT0_9BACT|nr:MAG: hypothetical protein A2799_02885 [Candidatus Roizmanbacteria bacterium RIFCSPHIGHO2_01_FULL_39_24]OGK27171.1 MAG: hypothetical protein A3D80_03065 [Candidatus Roizmanbacteria bacterium RIFCSPHIGHO2_02_FULL_40_13b]OGK49537.1 MAG: hypothetical protein A3A56_00025 [Candidatus Roizmanbacteria bacterium RIFCSPLOWO2_01_FULL_40_32]OGK57130.1 MAG: hypothetical protein A3H83_02180 [Candidatus Roizmanbacteria bacterium RIFCSPLOWO2_02_FULL_39_8]